MPQMNEEQYKLLERKAKLTGRINKVCETIDQDISYTFEKFFENNSYAYFALEEKLMGMKFLLETLRDQVKEAASVGDLLTFVGRMDYIEDRLDEMESQIYRRRRKRLHRFRLADFFNASQKEGQDNRVASLQTAYTLLGLTGQEGLLEVTATFRRLVKSCHPDARGGDRSDEGRLRKIMDAYQYIKQHFATM
jgi:hypothetical protein